MFIGHFGVGLGAKKFAPAISLGYLFIAAQFLDLLWPTLLLLDVEHVVIAPGITKVTPLDFTDYPVSHSLLMVSGWGVLFGAIAFLFTKSFKTAFIIFLCVISHWFLDLIVHRPDLPIMPASSDRFGFGLWNYPVVTYLLESIVFFTGLFFYTKTTSAKTKFGNYGLIILVALLILIYVANVFGPPPPDVASIAWAGHLQWLFVILAFYIDRHRCISIVK